MHPRRTRPSTPTVPPFREQVFALVRRIPRGRICSYGDIAAMLGRPRAARGVGWALASLSDEDAPGSATADAPFVPWWRVVNRNGEVSSPSLHHVAQRQRALLASEGIRFDAAGRIDRAQYGWWIPEGTGHQRHDP
jgi:methylated-DNA-protein-cysteine methyltransferase related protein